MIENKDNNNKSLVNVVITLVLSISLFKDNLLNLSNKEKSIYSLTA